MREFTASSFENAIKLLHSDMYNERLHRYRSNFVFRGVADSSYDLIASIQRKGYEYEKAEEGFLRNFLKYGEFPDKPFLDLIENLAIAQHHGIPTRLLDWTYSPLVALHFATDKIDKMETDGAVFAIDIMQSRDALPQKLKEAWLSENGPNLFTPQLISKSDIWFYELKDFEEVSNDPYFFFFEPDSMNARIRNQYGLFSAVSHKNKSMTEILEHHNLVEKALKKIIIPHKIKWEVRDKLDNSNINERMLFPGLDGLAAWLKRHYYKFDGANN